MSKADNPVTMTLPMSEKIAYGMGDVGSNLLLSVGTLYLMKFFTDVQGIPGVWAGIIFLVARFFTAFTDISCGLVMDSRQFGAKGKFRPFILYMAVPVAVVATANFIVLPFDMVTRTVIATMLFMLFGLCFSFLNCPYGAMVPAMTKNPNERAALAAFRQGGATIGLLICTVAFVPITQWVGQSPALHYPIAAMMLYILGVLCMWWCYKGVKERYVEVPKGTAKFSIMQSFKAIAANKQLLVLCIANLCTLAAFNIKLATQIYYTQYVLNDNTLMAYMGFFSMGCVLAGVLLVPSVVRRFGKKPVYLFGLSLWIIGDVLNYAIGFNSFLFVAFSCMAFFGTAFVNSLNWAMVSDTVEYGEWKTGLRSEGTVYTGFTFFRKISQGLAGFLPGLMLTMIGYMPNIVQKPETIEGLRQMIFIHPIVLALITMITIAFFYKLTEKFYLSMMDELTLRKSSKN